MQSERKQFDEKMLKYQNKNPNELEILKEAAVNDNYRPSQVDSGSSTLQIIILGILDLQDPGDSSEFKVSAACQLSMSNIREQRVFKVKKHEKYDFGLSYQPKERQSIKFKIPAHRLLQTSEKFVSLTLCHLTPSTIGNFKLEKKLGSALLDITDHNSS